MIRQSRVPNTCAVALLLAALGTSATAETVAELQAMARSSDAPAGGIALARRQISNDNLLDALATLERVLILHPEARDAQLLRAGVMCELDDRAGSTAEFDQLRGRVADNILRDAIARCDAVRSGRTTR
jgi:Tfp pilus assembly protein PilF